MKNLYIGALVKPRDDWKTFVPEPVLPSSYEKKRPEFISDWLDKKWADLEAAAATNPFVGEVVDFAFVDDDGNSFNPGPGSSGYPQLVEAVAPCHLHEYITLWGVQIRTRIHQAAVNAFERGFAGPTWGLFADTHTSRPVELGSVRMLDPVRLLMGGCSDEHVQALRNLIGTEGSWESAEEMAKFIRQIVIKFNLNGDVV